MLLLTSARSQPADVQALEVKPQYGTSLSDRGSFVSSNESGYLYTLGTICGLYCEGDYGEPVLKRFAASGKELWSRKLGVQCSDDIYRCQSLDYGLSIDPNGNSYALFGRVYTDTSTEGEPTHHDTTLKKFDPTGALLWTRPVYVGNLGQRQVEAVTATTPTSNTFVAYRFLDRDSERNAYFTALHLVKYNSSGKKIFDKPHIIENPTDAHIAGDGSLYLVGGGEVAKYTNAGALVWQRTLPLVTQHGMEQVAVSGGNVYVSLNTRMRSINPQNSVALYKYTNGGGLLWQRTFTSAGSIGVRGLSADTKGNAYLAGWASTASTDLFARKYTPLGDVAWTYAPKLSDTYESANDVSAADSGKIYLVGETNAEVDGKNYGGRDAFLLRLNSQGQKVWSR